MRLHPGLVALFLCVAAQTAFAQKVVILEFDGDKGGKLRAQVEAALKKAKTVEVVPIKAWKDAAAKKKLKGAQAMTPSAVGRLAGAVGVDAAVEGALGDTFFVRILDPEGAELWSKDLPLKKGLISDDHAKKLAKAIGAAAKSGPAPKPEPKAEPEEKPKKKPKPEEETAETSEESTESSEEGTEEVATPKRSQTDDDRRRAEEEAEAQAAMRAQAEADRDLEQEAKKPAKASVRPKVFKVGLGGRVTWRSYCSRPGVSTCAEYDAAVQRGEPVENGDTVTFSSTTPYGGFALEDLEVWPLSTLWEKMGGFGFGLVGRFGVGFSLIRIQINGAEPTEVVAVDTDWAAQLALRWHFSIGSFAGRGVSHIGVRAGGGGRTFKIDEAANVPLPGPERNFFQLGGDLHFAPVKWVGIDFSVTWFADPKPGATVVLGYGDATQPNGGVDAGGLQLEWGLSGDAIWLIGYSIKVRYTVFDDKFTGQGKKWTVDCNVGRCGGAANETYVDIIGSLNVSF